MASSILQDPIDPPSSTDLRILTMLDLHLARAPDASPISRNKGLDGKWSPPEEGTIKLNYDGATKGNSSSTGFEGVFKNAQGEVLWIYESNIGSSTNNMVELHALEHGITIAKSHKYSPLIIKGDSTLVMVVSKKLLQGMGTWPRFQIIGA